MILTRRTALCLVPAALVVSRAGWAASMPAVPEGGKLGFTVWRKGSQIGTHSADFTQSGDTLTVRTAAHFSVTFGPVTFYSYHYQVTETWKGGTLVGIEAKTNDNGTAGTCSATRNGDQLQVTGSKSGAYSAPAGAIAGTHWNKAEIAAPMINPENGVLMKFAVADKGSDTPPGGGAPAQHFALTGFATLDLWYDTAGTWVGLKALAKDGSAVEYHRA